MGIPEHGCPGWPLAAPGGPRGQTCGAAGHGWRARTRGPLSAGLCLHSAAAPRCAGVLASHWPAVRPEMRSSLRGGPLGLRVSEEQNGFLLALAEWPACATGWLNSSHSVFVKLLPLGRPPEMSHDLTPSGSGSWKAGGSRNRLAGGAEA